MFCRYIQTCSTWTSLYKYPPTPRHVQTSSVWGQNCRHSGRLTFDYNTLLFRINCRFWWTLPCNLRGWRRSRATHVTCAGSCSCEGSGWPTTWRPCTSSSGPRVTRDSGKFVRFYESWIDLDVLTPESVLKKTWLYTLKVCSHLTEFIPSPIFEPILFVQVGNG